MKLDYQTKYIFTVHCSVVSRFWAHLSEKSCNIKGSSLTIALRHFSWFSASTSSETDMGCTFSFQIFWCFSNFRTSLFFTWRNIVFGIIYHVQNYIKETTVQLIKTTMSNYISRQKIRAAFNQNAWRANLSLALCIVAFINLHYWLTQHFTSWDDHEFIENGFYSHQVFTLV